VSGSQLLLGIKDTDDTVVAATLKALACLVPILGGSTVIGGTRLKLFTNGMPKVSRNTNFEQRKLLIDLFHLIFFLSRKVKSDRPKSWKWCGGKPVQIQP
jgi:hypothetical protein